MLTSRKPLQVPSSAFMQHSNRTPSKSDTEDRGGRGCRYPASHPPLATAEKNPGRTQKPLGFTPNRQVTSLSQRTTKGMRLVICRSSPSLFQLPFPASTDSQLTSPGGSYLGARLRHPAAVETPPGRSEIEVQKRLARLGFRLFVFFSNHNSRTRLVMNRNLRLPTWLFVNI